MKDEELKTEEEAGFIPIEDLFCIPEEDLILDRHDIKKLNEEWED